MSEKVSSAPSVGSGSRASSVKASPPKPPKPPVRPSSSASSSTSTGKSGVASPARGTNDSVKLSKEARATEKSGEAGASSLVGALRQNMRSEPPEGASSPNASGTVKAMSMESSDAPRGGSGYGLNPSDRVAPLGSDPGNSAGRAQGKTEIANLLDRSDLGLNDEQKAIFTAEIPFEQSQPSLRGETGPGGVGGRDASKDYTNNGGMNIGPFNDNVEMLWKYGGLKMPMKDGTDRAGDPYGSQQSDHQQMKSFDWDKIRGKFGKNVSDQTLGDIVKAKKTALDTIGVDSYYAARRGGSGVVSRGGAEGKHNGFGYNPSTYFPNQSNRSRYEGDLKSWVADHKKVAGHFLGQPSARTDGYRYATRDFPHVNDGGITGG